MALAPNVGYGLLNSHTTTPGSTAPDLSGTLANVGGPAVGQGSGGLPGLGSTIAGALNTGTVPGQDSITIPPDFSSKYGVAPAPPASPTPPVPPPAAPHFNGATDPNVLASQALEHEGLGGLDAWLRSAREKAIIGFGDPALASQAGFGLDPQAGAFAQQNYLSGNSTLSRLDRQHKLQRDAIINRLASHGILNSGDLGFQEGEENTSYGNATYDAKQQVLDYLASLLSSYNSQQQQLRQNVINARQAAISNFLSNPDGYAAAFGA